jgi:hypothetical protein
MNDHDPTPSPRPPGYDAEESAFDSFNRGYRPLADDLTTSVNTTLGSHTSLDGNAFSRVGNDVGLSAAIRDATQRQADRISGLAGNTTNMADAVANTYTNYVELEDEADVRMRRAAGEIV